MDYASRILTVLLGKHFGICQKIGTTIAKISIRSKKPTKMIGTNSIVFPYPSMCYMQNYAFLTSNGFEKTNTLNIRPDFWQENNYRYSNFK